MGSSGTNPCHTSQELAVVQAKVAEHEKEINQLGLAVRESTHSLLASKRNLAAFQRTLDERADSLEAEKTRARDLQRSVDRVKEDKDRIQREMAAVIQEIAELKAQDGNSHPMFMPFQDALGQLLEQAACPAAGDAPLPHIDNLANKLVQRIERVASTCQEFLRPAIEKETQRYFTPSAVLTPKGA